MDSNPIRRLRTALGLSQEKFARELGISTASVRAYEGGQRLSEAALEKLKSLAARHMLPDIAIDLDQRPFSPRKVFEPGSRVRLPANPACGDLRDMLHAALDEILDSGSADAIAAVDALLQFARNTATAEKTKTAGKSG